MCLVGKDTKLGQLDPIGTNGIGQKAYHNIDPLMSTAVDNTQQTTNWLKGTFNPAMGAAPAAPLQGDIALQPIRKVYGGTLLTGG